MRDLRKEKLAHMIRMDKEGSLFDFLQRNLNLIVINFPNETYLSALYNELKKTEGMDDDELDVFMLLGIAVSSETHEKGSLTRMLRRVSTLTQQERG